jgi:hypothetical protein
MTKHKGTLSPGGKRIGRPPLSDDTVLLTARVPVDLVAALDRYTASLAEKHRGITISRSDALRRLLVDGLDREGVTDDK